MLRPSLMGALVTAALAWPAAAQDSYVVGVSGALTGPAAGTNAPPIEGLRLYVDRLNAGGGVNGKKIQLIVLDDQAEPSKAAANAKRLLSQDNVRLLVLSSLSSTYAPVIAETKRANVPLMLMGAVCPKEVYPPAEALQFCTTAYAGGYDSRATLAFIKETAKEPVRIGFAAMAIPLSRGEIDYAEEQAKTHGHDRGRQGGDSAADRGLHAVRHQAQGRQPELDIFLGAMGDPGEDLRGAAPAGLAGRLHHLGTHRGGGRIGPPQGSRSST